jgi:hypothetical protein
MDDASTCDLYVSFDDLLDDVDGSLFVITLFFVDASLKIAVLAKFSDDVDVVFCLNGVPYLYYILQIF